MTQSIDDKPIVEVSRGGIVESSHLAVAAVARGDGEILAAWGSTDHVTFLRSSAKPFQCIPLVESGAAAHFGLSEQELGIICASHAGTDEHVSVVQSILEKIGLEESNLRCGTHVPYDKRTQSRLIAAGKDPSALHHNCSGKHAGMLALARYLDAPVQTYLEPDHPVQQMILQTFSEMASMNPGEIVIGTDGCSAPNYAIPMGSAATAYACLMDAERISTKRAAGCKTIVRAMTAHPQMVSGEGRFDTVLMQKTSAGLLSKGGAEGYQGIGVPRGALSPDSPALGIALKVLDGDSGSRARSVAILAILRALDIVTPEELQRLAAFDARTLFNQSDLPVGAIRASAAVQDFFTLAHE